MTTLWVLPFSQFSVHLTDHSSSPHFLSFPRRILWGDRVESLAEVKVDNIHCSSFIYPASHAIVESYQIGQAWFPLGESVLTTPNNLLFLHLLDDDDLQDKLLHHLSQDGGEADRPVVPWVLLLAFFEDWSNLCAIFLKSSLWKTEKCCEFSVNLAPG